MELSVRDAATILGVSSRTARARAARGELRARKHNGRWRIRSEGLPLTDIQRRKLEAKADRIRTAMDDVLPQRGGGHPHSVADLEAFRAGAQVLATVRDEGSAALPGATLAQVDELLSGALFDQAEAVLQYDAGLKQAALVATRRRLAHAVAHLLIAASPAPDSPARRWAARIEGEVLPAVVGFARWTERRRGRRGPGR